MRDSNVTVCHSFATKASRTDVCLSTMKRGAKDATASPATASTVWVSNGTTIAPAAVTTGATDGIYTAIVWAPFGEGARVVTRMST